MFCLHPTEYHSDEFKYYPCEMCGLRDANHFFTLPVYPDYYIQSLEKQKVNRESGQFVCWFCLQVVDRHHFTSILCLCQELRKLEKAICRKFRIRNSSNVRFWDWERTRRLNFLNETLKQDMVCAKRKAIEAAWCKAALEEEKHRLYTTTVRTGEILTILEVSLPHMCPVERARSFLPQEDWRRKLKNKWGMDVFLFDQPDPENPRFSLDLTPDQPFGVYPQVFVVLPGLKLTQLEYHIPENTWQNRADWGSLLAEIINQNSEYYAYGTVGTVRYVGDLWFLNSDSDDPYLSKYLTIENTMFCIEMEHFGRVGPGLANILSNPELMKQYYAPEHRQLALKYDYERARKRS